MSTFWRYHKEYAPEGQLFDEQAQGCPTREELEAGGWRDHPFKAGVVPARLRHDPAANDAARTMEGQPSDDIGGGWRNPPPSPQNALEDEIVQKELARLREERDAAIRETETLKQRAERLEEEHSDRSNDASKLDGDPERHGLKKNRGRRQGKKVVDLKPGA